jgi:hypothetical protein
VTATWGLAITTLTPVSAAIGAVAVSGGIIRSIFDKKLARKTSPLNYLLSVRKRLRPKTMAKDIVGLKLSIEDDGDSSVNAKVSSVGRVFAPPRRGLMKRKIR